MIYLYDVSGDDSMNWQDKYKNYSLFRTGTHTNLYEVLGQDNKVYILKELINKGDIKEKRKFKREIYIILKLKNNSNIIDIVDYSKEEDELWYVREKATTNLYNYVKVNKALKEDVSIKIIEDILNALDFAHNNRILHRDLSPFNILVNETNNGLGIRLSDFGLASDYSKESSEIDHENIEKLEHTAFAAPEQLESIANSTVASEIYATGALLSFMLTGEDPREQRPQSEIGLIVNNCMEQDPHNRPKTLKSVIHLFNTYCTEQKYTNMNLHNIIYRFILYNYLTENEVIHLNRHMVLYKEYSNGELAYTRFFKPLLSIPENLYQYWTFTTDKYVLDDFIEKYCKQLLFIINQDDWPKKEIKNLTYILANCFNNLTNPYSIGLVLDTLFEVYLKGFGDTKKSIEKIIYQKYKEDEIVLAIAGVLKEKNLKSLDLDDERIKHSEFKKCIKGD